MTPKEKVEFLESRYRWAEKEMKIAIERRKDYYNLWQAEHRRLIARQLGE